MRLLKLLNKLTGDISWAPFHLTTKTIPFPSQFRCCLWSGCVFRSQCTVFNRLFETRCKWCLSNVLRPSTHRSTSTRELRDEDTTIEKWSEKPVSTLRLNCWQTGCSKHVCDILWHTGLSWVYCLLPINCVDGYIALWGWIS